MIWNRISSSFLVFGLALLIVSAAVAQQPATGLPPLGTFASSGFDNIDLANLDVHFEIPVFARPGRGIPFHYNLGYDSLVWMPVTSGGVTSWSPVNSNWGWRAVTEAATGYVTYGTWSNLQSCPYRSGGVLLYGATTTTYSYFAYHDPAGGVHAFPGTVTVYSVNNPSECGSSYLTPISNAVTTDNSGYIISTNTSSALGQVTVHARGGLSILTPAVGSATGAGSVTDANGNQISVSSSGAFTDTLDSNGSHVLTVSGTPPGNVTYAYAAPTGNQVSVTVSYVEYWVQTCFQISGIDEYPVTEVPLVDKVTLPDGTYYQFTYEPTLGCGAPSGRVTGRLASVTLPTGGQVTYSYEVSNSNDMTALGSPWYMQRSYGGGTWNYWFSGQPGQPSTQTTTSVLDPAQNETDLNFTGVYQTSSNTYTGNTLWGTSRTLLKSTTTCYNGVFTNNCQTSIATPITDRYFYDDLTNQSIYSVKVDGFDSYGNDIWHQDYDYSSSPSIIHVVNTSYSNINNICSSRNICDHPASVQVTDASNPPVQYALTNYSYNGNGNTTEVSKWVSGSSYLNQNYQYNGNGTLSTATDPNGTVTTYGYGSNSCNGVFPDSVSVPGDNGTTITWNYAYNCAGGVVTQFTDVANNHWGGAGYSDPYFWRPQYTRDLADYVTYYNYYGATNYGTSAVTQVGQVESILSIGSGAEVDTLSTADNLGRPSLTQTREAPGSGIWDSMEYLYDGNGRVSWVTLPFTGSAGVVQQNLPGMGYSYDALNRYVDISQSPWTQLDVHYSYSQNDVEVMVNPAPTGENPKSRQFQYDVLGRVTSVCEITSMSGSGTCSQNTGQTGFFTSYSYDPLGDLKQVSQIGQSRTYNFDGLSRLTAESNPETSQSGAGGSTHYTYDSVSDGKCSFNSAGDEVERIDPAGNYSCYQYDGLHRMTSVTYPSGPNTANMPGKYFQYDIASPWGFSVSNPVGRLVLAYTYLNPTTYSGDVFSYDARGEVTDYYQYSGSWYHIQQGYFANGATASLQGFNGMGTTTPLSDLFTYGLDGEGRVYSILDTTTDAPILGSTTYNSASQPTAVLSESFKYDANSGRMTQWASTVGSDQQIGSPTWNANGTLQSMQINDNANNANTQNCAYTYDDLARLHSVNCGANTWQQNFNYDVLGNITKTVPTGGTGVTFNPGYGSGNHVSGFSYDGMGNVTHDNLGNSYTYDAEGRPVSAAGVTTTYDAFGRAVENSNGGGTQIVYSPTGWKFALMNGTSLIKYRVPMPGGMVATHNGDGTGYYQHADWLGSSRFATSAGVRYDRAYAPFGEAYAELNGNTENRTFTGPQEDTTPGIDDFLFRQYSASQGRWLVPDPAGMAAVDITNPQTWNRYAYVGNNPLNKVDPLGLIDCADDDEDGSDCNDPNWGGGGGGSGSEEFFYGGPPPAPPDYSGVNSLLCGGLFCNFQQFYALLYSGGGGGGGRAPNNGPPRIQPAKRSS